MSQFVLMYGKGFCFVSFNISTHCFVEACIRYVSYPRIGTTHFFSIDSVYLLFNKNDCPCHLSTANLSYNQRFLAILTTIPYTNATTKNVYMYKENTISEFIFLLADTCIHTLAGCIPFPFNAIDKRT